ncbi:hypothetical protein AJ79_01625 [Helicocarpus griseus UAMH5409]|uniref:SET domain-containing protein n=1 Tax=Helicocarpus griseus UAMH5409 TaxID=1447875 RepID=A0A2B7Y5L0_9EURO|nr:hypothetical protein AJ79_01625 [Helicocarpus griseus UAMH5409]
MATDSLGAEHLSFMQWSISEGIVINGVTPANIRGRGVGMVATRLIEKDEVMLEVPVETMLTIDSIPTSFVEMFPKGTPVQGILAAFLTKGDPELLRRWESWREVWPSRQSFKDTMPILWPEWLRDLDSVVHGKIHTGQPTLPPSVSGLWNSIQKPPVDFKYEAKYQNILGQQEQRLQDAWKNIFVVFPEVDWDTFSYYWLILNSRCFYYYGPGKEPPKDWNDAIGLLPFGDYFNHADNADCEVTFNDHKYVFKATRRYEKGEEVYMSYGAHTNDFLWVEYGFFLDHNPSDAIFLDDIIFRDLAEPEKEELRSHQEFGNYKLTSSGPCSRTQVAACIKYMTRANWRKYALGRSTKGVKIKKTAHIIRGWIEVYIKESEAAILTLEAILSTKGAAIAKWEEKIAICLDRWNQIRRLCENASTALDSSLAQV